MTEIIFVRHGNTFLSTQLCVQVGKATDIPLTPAGHQQAIKVAEYLQCQDIQPDILFTGHLMRQQQTTKVIAEQLGRDSCVQQTEALDEIDYGDWEGLTPTALAALWPVAYQLWQEQGKWPESFRGTALGHLTQLKAWLARVEQAPWTVVVAVSSQGLIRLLLQLIPNLYQQLVSTETYKNYRIKTGHLCHFTLQKQTLTVRAWNIDPQASSSSLCLSRC